jgi:two-component system, NarL family, response regulator NreC
MKIKVLAGKNLIFPAHDLSARLQGSKNIRVVPDTDISSPRSELIPLYKCDILIVDLDRPGNLDILKEIAKKHNEKARIIALSKNNDRDHISNFFHAGGRGFLLKTCSFEEIVSAIKSVYAGKFYLCPSLGGQMIHDRSLNLQDPHDHITLEGLTRREKEVLHLIQQGKTVKEIAAILCICYGTAKNHKYNIMEKLRIHSTPKIINKTMNLDFD